MKLPPNFKLIHELEEEFDGTNKIKLKFSYRYENGEIYEEEIKCDSLFNLLNKLNYYSFLIDFIKKMNLPKNFHVKFSFDPNRPYHVYCKNKLISKYSKNHLEWLHDRWKKSLVEIDVLDIINKLNNNEEITEEECKKICIY